MFLRLSSFVLCMLLAACGKDTPPPPPGPKLVGRIASIPPGRKFVLIESYSKWEVPTGSVLTSRGPNERASNLRVTGEQLGQYAAADLQSGQVELGDPVYLPPPAQKDTNQEPSASAETASPSVPTAEPEPNQAPPDLNN